MQLFTIILFASTFIGHLLAFPTSTSFSTRGWQDCPAHTSFFSCKNNGFVGCCSIDPCNLATCPVSRLACPPGQHALYAPMMYNLDPTAPNSSSNTSSISIYQGVDGTAVHQQFAVFSGISQFATSCTLGWSTGAQSQLTVSGSGLIDAAVVEGPIPPSITWNTVHPIAVNVTKTPEFTGWSGKQFEGANTHDAGAVDCASEIAILFGIHGDSAGNVQLAANTVDTGFFLGYVC